MSPEKKENTRAKYRDCYKKKEEMMTYNNKEQLEKKNEMNIKNTTD